MPYIPTQNRLDLNNGSKAVTSGELNYLITGLITEYLHSRGTSYSTMNDIVGALECAKMEFNRRIVAPYENSKLALNGDVYHVEPKIPQTPSTR